jgi:mannose-6-phosphate isomerase-like protein (cupin superfamily)
VRSRDGTGVCAAALGGILADDVTAVGGIGSEDDKAAILADVKSHDLTYKKLTYDDRKIRIYGDAAVVTSHAEVVAKYKERGLTGKIFGTRVYAKEQGNWKLVAMQSTKIPEHVSIAAQDTTYQASAEDTSKVVFVSAKQLDSEIHKVPEIGPGTFLVDLIEYNATKGGVSVLRRTRPGRAEVHKRLTDTWYVIQGEGTLVTGGSLSESTETEADEFRGRGITGGEERQIEKGDFVKIPAGVPHWVQKIDGKELVYLVVKVALPK